MSARPRKEVKPDTYSARFALRLKELREKAGLTVDQLAEKSGIPKRTLYQWESATKIPGIDRLPQLANALRIKISKLLPEK